MAFFGNSQQAIPNLKDLLDKSLSQLYGTSNKADYAQVLDSVNKEIPSAVCAKRLTYGDIAWRCLDCEKDPTCIICKDCFEKGDHDGHRVMLKRNTSGCCDCGDPDGWDENHFCSDHKGYKMDPEEILKRMPTQMRAAAEQVFEDLAVNLKRQCMRLQKHG